MFNVVLFNPQIPPNTGNIGRLCVNSGATLHLVRPLGFKIGQKEVRRAGLDYWKRLRLEVWNSIDHFFEGIKEKGIEFHQLHFATTKGLNFHFSVSYQPGDYLIFGSETAGIPNQILKRFQTQTVKIPMGPEGRSLNLAVSVGIVLYEAIRQNFSKWEEEVNFSIKTTNRLER